MAVLLEVFVRDFNRSKKSVRKVARALRRQGFKVRVPPMELTGIPDICDIYMQVNGELKQAEVKHSRTLTFTSLDDINYKEVMIDSDYRIENREPGKLYAYFLCNKDLTKALIVKNYTRHLWHKEKKFVQRENYGKGEDKMFYFISREFVCGILELK